MFDPVNRPPAPAQRRAAPSADAAGSVTLHDVAREAGVSMSTASRALNGSTRTVRGENLAAVLLAAEKLGYTPHLSAQAIATGSTKTAALVVSDIADPYFSCIAAGAVDFAEQAGLVVTMAVADRSPERELEIVSTLRGYRPRVIIVAGSRIDGVETCRALVEELEAYQTAGGRVVMVSQAELPFHTVTVDNAGAAHELATALVALGYRRFAVLHGPAGLRTSRERVEGFRAGLAESGLTIDASHTVETEFTYAGGYAGVTELLRRGLDGAELIFATNDIMAIGAMTALRDAGRTPGQDIAVAGFDDIEPAADVVPGLTTVHLPLRALGWRALEVALEDSDQPAVVHLPTRVVLRDSTPPR